jgi:hypothetical protein
MHHMGKTDSVTVAWYERVNLYNRQIMIIR